MVGGFNLHSPHRLFLLLIAQIYIIIGFSKMPEEIGEEPAPSAEEVITW